MFILFLTKKKIIIVLVQYILGYLNKSLFEIYETILKVFKYKETDFEN